MAEMLPRCQGDAEVDEIIVGDGQTGERVLYRLMRDYLPDNWCVIWNRRIANENINHQYDFIVLVPRMGVLILDAKGHGFGYNDDGVLGCWHNGNFEPRNDLFDRIQNAKTAFIQDIRDHFGNFGACNCLVAFIDQFMLPNANTPAPIDWIDRIQERIAQDSNCLRDRITTLLAANINGLDLRNFHRDFTDDMMRQIKEYFAQRNGWQIHFQDDFYQWETDAKNYLSTRQRRAVNIAQNSSAMHIQGGAGTGKTILAVMLAKEFANQGQRVLYVCYNRKLADFLNHKRRQGHWHNIVVSNYDSIGSIQLAAYGNDTLRTRLGWPRVQGNRDAWDDNQWLAERNRICNSLFAPPNNRRLDNFDVLIIDEAQDLDNKYIASLFCLKKANGKIFIFSDENQSLYSDGWKLDTKNLFPNNECKSMLLEENWRNTIQIHEHFSNILADQSIGMFNGTVGVTQVRRDAVQGMIKMFLEAGRCPQNIALLAIGDINLNDFMNVNYGQGRNVSISDNMEKWYGNQSILKTNVKGFKGLDADIVFLFGDVPLPNNDRLHDQREKDRYVGESRAKYELYIVID